jgi:hypothetical protein
LKALLRCLLPLNKPKVEQFGMTATTTASVFTQGWFQWNLGFSSGSHIARIARGKVIVVVYFDLPLFKGKPQGQFQALHR